MADELTTASDPGQFVSWSNSSAFGYPSYGLLGATGGDTGGGFGYPAAGVDSGGAGGSLVSWAPPDQSISNYALQSNVPNFPSAPALTTNLPGVDYGPSAAPSALTTNLPGADYGPAYSDSSGAVPSLMGGTTLGQTPVSGNMTSDPWANVAGWGGSTSRSPVLTSDQWATVPGYGTGGGAPANLNAGFAPGASYGTNAVSTPGGIPGVGFDTGAPISAPAGFSLSPWSSEGGFSQPGNGWSQFGGSTGYPAYGMGHGTNWATPQSQGPSLASIVSQLESQGGATAYKQPPGMKNPTYGQYPAFVQDYGYGAAGVDAFGSAVQRANPNATVGDYYSNYVLSTSRPGRFTFGSLQDPALMAANPGARGAASNFINNAGVAPGTSLAAVQATNPTYVTPAASTDYASAYGDPSAAAASYFGGGAPSVPAYAAQAGQYSKSLAPHR